MKLLPLSEPSVENVGAQPTEAVVSDVNEIQDSRTMLDRMRKGFRSNISGTMRGILGGLLLAGSVFSTAAFVHSVGDSLSAESSMESFETSWPTQRLMLTLAAVSNSLFCGWMILSGISLQIKRIRDEALVRKNAELLDRISDLEGMVETKKAEIEAKIAEIAALAEKLEALTADVKKLQVEKGELRVELSLKNKVVRDLEKKVRVLETEVFWKNNEIAELQKMIGRFEGYKDASVISAANDMTLKMRELVDGFSAKLKGLVHEDSGNGLRLVFTVNPELEAMMDVVRTDLEQMTSNWLAEDLPADQREYNAEVLAPLLMQFERIEGLFKSANFRSAVEEIFKLIGKIDLLKEMNDGEDTELEGDSPEELWSSYLEQNNVDASWVNKQGRLHDFFKILEIEEVGVWTQEFWNLAHKAYRKMARKYHPDIFEGSDDKFKQINTAKEIFQNSVISGKYFRIFIDYKKIFSN